MSDKKPWAKWETETLADLCLGVYPHQPATVLAKKVSAYHPENRSLAALENRINLIRRAAAGELGWHYMPQQIRDVVKLMQGEK